MVHDRYWQISVQHLQSKHIVINFDIGKVCSHELKENINSYINYVHRKTEQSEGDHTQYMVFSHSGFFPLFSPQII